MIFRRILLPLLAPAIAAGALFAFAISFDELIVALFIGGPDQFTLDWLARALDLMHAHGILVDLATASASPPPWFSKLHPKK